MAFQKCLLNGELMLIAITLSLANKMEYGQIANNTKYEQISNNTEYKQISNNTETNEQIANNTKYEQIANNTEYKQIVNNTQYKQFVNNTQYEQIANKTKDEQISNNTEYKEITNDTENTVINYNLPVIVSFHYNVEMLLYFKDNLLFGVCSINISVDRQLESIKLKSIPIRIIEAVLIDSKNTSVYKFSSFTNYNNTLTINFDERIFPNIYTLNVTYMRMIHEDRNSLRSVYQDKLGDRILNQTGIEVMKAQQLFPCSDELNINATFKIAIKHDKKYTVLSNMPIRARNKADYDMMWTDFDESLLMSAKHILVVITTFTNVSSPLANVTIWCRQIAREHVFFAKNVLEEVIPYFRQEYLTQLSKLDIVAFRHFQDDNIGTLGLVLLREADIVYNEALHPIIRQREVAHVIARLLAFVWCGDALFWSKKGFATFFGAYILDQIYQNNHMMDLMVVQAQQDSFRYDIPSTIDFSTLKLANISLVNSLESPLDHMKSFIIWRMIYNILPDVFWRGIHTYIDMHRNFVNMTSPDDLWTTMQTIHNETSPNNTFHANLSEIITSWITRNYYFILNVTYHPSRKLFFDLMQSTYLLDKIPIWLPVSYTSQMLLHLNKTYTLYLTNILPSNESSIRIVRDADDDWIIANVQQAGYFRVNYDFKNWQKLTRYLNSEDYNKIHILNRAQIIDDAFYFFLQRQLSYNTFWNLTNFVLRDTNFVTWYPMIKVFEFITCIYPLQYGKVTTDRIKSRIDGLLAAIGYFDESTDNALIYLRQEAVKWACILGLPACQKIAALELNKELQNSVEDNNLIGKKWIYCYGSITTNHIIWHKIWQRWNATSDKRFLEYLTCSENSTVTSNFLETTLMEKVQFNETKRSSKRAYAFLFIVAKGIEKDNVRFSIFKNIKDLRLSSNRRNDIIATLIVIITHVHKEDHMKQIFNFIIDYEEEQIVKAVEKKIKKRRSEYGRLIRNYGYFSLKS